MKSLIDNWFASNANKSLWKLAQDGTKLSWRLGLSSIFIVCILFASGRYSSLSMWIPDSLELSLLTTFTIFLPLQGFFKRIIFHPKIIAIFIIGLCGLATLTTATTGFFPIFIKEANINFTGNEFFFKTLFVLIYPLAIYVYCFIFAAINIIHMLIAVSCFKVICMLRITRTIDFWTALILTIIPFGLIPYCWQQIIASLFFF
jgi:hypothetical protein